ncbi:Cap-specific mRNA (nucleoside-2'-O-)-methyltransferase 1 [Nymphon striatum]|nr:Cap-specific mRNA (nucleoside-2'-O-)-methyltransferase 1 [Nymphon striatum]
MGYQKGSGLGKHLQGKNDIVEASKQRGRRGLGLQIAGFEPSEDIKWNAEDEVISVEEPVTWIPECQEDPPVMADLRRWPKEGPKNMTITDETHFCDPSCIRRLLEGKSIFDDLAPEEMRKARSRSNPFETIRGVMFQNRAAMKMANMDFVFDFMFTEPIDSSGVSSLYSIIHLNSSVYPHWASAPRDTPSHPCSSIFDQEGLAQVHHPGGMSLVDPNELLYFADVCAGPGGFSEYVLWRKKWHCKGFGFTLKEQNDFKLEEFYAGPAEMFEPHYGLNGTEGDGNVFIPENTIAFRKFVLESTEGKGVHFVMADGGFSVEGQENIQEILSNQLYLCQFMFALSILRTDGHFVCKLFDIFTPFSVGLVYLMYRCFKHVSIHKPNTSRPANSERYIICKWRRENTKDIHDYMFELNCRIQQLKLGKSSEDIIEVVPLEMIKQNKDFYEYIFESNMSLGKRQVVNLAKIKAFVQNIELYEMSQNEMRTQSLKAWKIPDEVRSSPWSTDQKKIYQNLIKNSDMSYCVKDAEDLNLKKLDDIKSVYEYRCMVSGADNSSKTERRFILGLGVKSDGEELSECCTWQQVTNSASTPFPRFLFTASSNTSTAISDGNALDFFNLYFDDKLLDIISIETNRYAGRNTISDWSPTDSDEMRVFLAITMLQGLISCVGKETHQDHNNFSKSSQIVMSLMKSLLGKGHCLTTENLYTSPQLADLLLKHRTDIYGTVKQTRKEMPLELKKKKLKEVKNISFQRGKVIVMKWKDKRDVTLLSTVYSLKMMECQHNNKTVLISHIADDYNNTMGRVDHVDQTLSTYPIRRKRGKKYYQKIFFHFLELAVWNSYILYKKSGSEKNPLDYRLELIHLLIKKYKYSTKSCGRPGTSANPLRLSARHFPDIIPPTEKKTNPTRMCAITRVMKGDGSNNCKWKKLEMTLELPKDTVLYAEIVNELQGEGRAQKKVKALHILDALFLGGKDIRHLDFVER